ncbi:hypothetical protein PsAD5_00108 [Pseudovibrio sp. Ad5]|nr:hypothetical protein PsAD5_00108 [Pseudovibrio sp. Ad5]
MMTNGEYVGFLDKFLSRQRDDTAVWAVKNLPDRTTTRQIHDLNHFIDKLVYDATEMAFRIGAKAQKARQTFDESYELGKRDGYEQAVQDIDKATGGDGEYVAILGDDPEGRNCPDPETMQAKIIARFEQSQ